MKHTSSIGIAGVLVLAAVAAAQDAPAPAKPAANERWTSMFDGVSLGRWKETPFAGHGKVSVEGGAIVLGSGSMTGVNWTGAFPNSNYEVRLEAMRYDGDDFFAGITFPVRGSFCSWINGGWGGTVVGLSSIDSMDASENETSTRFEFESNRWYKLRLLVVDEGVQAWIDGKLVVDVYLVGRAVELRPGQIDLSKPFGIASYWTTAKLRNIEYRALPPAGGRAVKP